MHLYHTIYHTQVSKTSLGMLSGAFMGGYCALSPVFAALAQSQPPFLLMGLGLFFSFSSLLFLFFIFCSFFLFLLLRAQSCVRSSGSIPASVSPHGSRSLFLLFPLFFFFPLFSFFLFLLFTTARSVLCWQLWLNPSLGFSSIGALCRMVALCLVECVLLL